MENDLLKSALAEQENPRVTSSNFAAELRTAQTYGQSSNGPLSLITLDKKLRSLDVDHYRLAKDFGPLRREVGELRELLTAILDATGYAIQQVPEVPKIPATIKLVKVPRPKG